MIEFVTTAIRFFIVSLFTGDNIIMSTQIDHKTYESYYMDHNLDPYGLNTDPEKTNRLDAAYRPWRTKDVPLSTPDLKEVVSDQFADHNIGSVFLVL